MKKTKTKAQIQEAELIDTRLEICKERPRTCIGEEEQLSAIKEEWMIVWKLVLDDWQILSF